MNILYWNINRAVTNEKTNWLDKAITSESPDIICIAEGPEGIDDCKDFVKYISDKNYYSYYTPTLYSEPVISDQYGWNKFGLKVFVKNGSSLKSKFAFGNQKVEGRIIYLRFEQGGENYSVFLIHGMSKVGDDLNQNDFVIELSHFIQAKTLDKGDDKIIIFGDFNIEPWDELLKKKRYIFSLFFKKQQEYYSNHLIKRKYINPAFDYIQNHKDKELIGTFYNKSYVSLFDFPLISDSVENFDFKIIPELFGQKILTTNNSKNILADGLDHLPVQLNIL
jgi:exonuclease III